MSSTSSKRIEPPKVINNKKQGDAVMITVIGNIQNLAKKPDTGKPFCGMLYLKFKGVKEAQSWVEMFEYCATVAYKGAGRQGQIFQVSAVEPDGHLDLFFSNNEELPVVMFKMRYGAPMKLPEGL